MLLSEAVTLARHFHDGATDKAGRPYIGHPLRVMRGVETHDEKIAAVLHDLIEDTEITLTDLMVAGCPSRVLEALKALTRNPGEDYVDFVLRAAANPIARVVKLADIADNLDPERLSHLDEGLIAKLRAKYEPARAVLEASEPAELPAPLFSGNETFEESDDLIAYFACDLCGHPAARLVFIRDGRHGDLSVGKSAIVITNFTGRHWMLVEKGATELEDAIKARDRCGIWDLKRNYMPCFCRECQMMYCERHLDVRPGYGSNTYALCPQNHDRVLVA